MNRGAKRISLLAVFLIKSWVWENMKYYTEKCGFRIESTERDGNVELIRLVSDQFERKEKKLYLVSTECIDYNHPLVQEKAAELKEKTGSSLDYIKRAYEFVRDEIPHSWDIGAEVVSQKASDVLQNKTVK